MVKNWLRSVLRHIDSLEGECGQMTRERRNRLILSFLADQGVMFTQKQLFDNLERYRYATFSYSSVIRSLEELEEDGYVERIETGMGYWVITDAGRDHLAELEE